MRYDLILYFHHTSKAPSW